MTARDLFGDAFASLVQHKLRTVLTMLGMMFGVAAVIAMLSIGAGAEQRALAAIERLGTRNVIVNAKEADLETRKKSLGLTLRDVDAIREAIPGVADVAPRIAIDVRSLHAGAVRTKAQAFGISVQPFALSEGRLLDARDEAHASQHCVIGAGVRRDLFGTDRLGDIEINDLWCRVVGVLAPDAATDRDIYLPFTTALAKLDRDPLASPLGSIVIHLEPGVAADTTGGYVDTLLARLHAGARDYEVVVPATLLAHSQETRRLFDLVMGLIAGISLLVGGVGIVNVMLASVLEQTREIGVRRAVGARRRDIAMQFLVTSFALALTGGVLGVALGISIARVVAASSQWPTVVTLPSIALALGVSVVVGVVAGLYPARRAAHLDPIQALR